MIRNAFPRKGISGSFAGKYRTPRSWRLVFYSNDHGGLLADTGLPTDFYANAVRIFENNAGATIYTPTVGQPGFEAGFPLPITYQIFSTPDLGTTLSLFAVALLGLSLLGRKFALS